MKILLLFSLKFLLFLNSYSQITSVSSPIINSSTVISGKLLNATSFEPIDGAWIKVDSQNNQPIQSIFSDAKGIYSIKLLKNQSYTLKIRLLGFKEKEYVFNTFSSDELKLPTLYLEEEIYEMKEVLTKSTPLDFIQERNKSIIFIHETEEDQKTNLYDLILKAPFISVGIDGQLSQNGQILYEMFINGKPSHLTFDNLNDILKSIPGKIVKEIEIWQSPPPQYRNYGNQPIINLILKQDYLNGLTIGNNLASSYIPENTNENKGLRNNLFINKKSKKTTLSFNGTVNDQYEPLSRNLLKRIDELTKDQLTQESTTKSTSNGLQFSSNVNFDLDSLNDLSIAANISNTKLGYQALQDFQWSSVDNINSIENLINQYRNNNKTQNGKIAIQSNHWLDRKQTQKISLDYSFFQQGNQSLSSINEKNSSNDTKDLQEIYNEKNFNEHKGSVNYFKEFKSLDIESGINFSNSNEDSQFIFTNLNPVSGELVNNEEFKSSTISNVKNLNINLGLNKMFEKGSLNFGVNLDNTILKGEFSEVFESINNQYSNLLPYFSLFWTPKENWSFNFNYLKNWNIPDLFYLNPFVDKTDPFHINSGNKDLKPSQNHNYSLSINRPFRNFYPSLKLSYSFHEDKILNFSTIENGITYTTFKNIGRNKNLNINYNNSFTLNKKLSTSFQLNASLITFESQIGEQFVSNQRWNYTFFSNFRFKLSKSLRLMYSFNYFSDQLNFLEVTQSMFRSNATLNLDLGKRKNSGLQLTVNNPQAKERVVFTEISNPNFFQSTQSSMAIQKYTLTYQLRWNKFQ